MKILEVETSYDYIAFLIKVQKKDTTLGIINSLLKDRRCQGNVYNSTLMKISPTKIWITFYTKPGYEWRRSGLQAPGAKDLLLQNKDMVEFKEIK